MHPITADTTLGQLADLVVDEPAERVVVDTTSDGRREGDRDIVLAGRTRRIPYMACAVTGAAGWAAYGLTQITPDPTAVTIGTCAATAVAVPVLRAIWRHRIPDAWRARWWLAACSGAAWIDIAAVHGPNSLPMTAALVLGAAAVGARWCDEHQVPHPNQTPSLPVDARPVAMSRVQLIEHRWVTRVADGPSAVARESWLTDRTEVGAGYRWTVELDPTRNVGASRLCQRAADVALALEIDVDEVMLERAGREDRAILTVATSRVLTAGLTYRGPEYLDGRVPVGGHMDGDAEAEFIAWEPGQGARNGLASGDMGSGKTALLELVALGLRKSGVWRVWFGDGDPQGGSSNLLMDPRVSHWATAGPEGLLQQLGAFETLLETRARQKSQYTLDRVSGLPVPRKRAEQPSVREFPPCAEFPGYMWFMPEFFTISQDPTLTAAGFVPRLEAALRRSRKYCLAATVDTQSMLGKDFAGSSTMRAFLAMSNAFMMRTTNQSDQWTVNGITVSPGLLPKGGGYGITAGRGQGGGIMRTFWQPDLHRWIPGLPECAEDELAAEAIKPFLPAPVDADAALDQERAALDVWREQLRSRRAEPAVPTVGAVPGSTDRFSVPAPLAKVIQMPGHSDPAEGREERPLPPKAVQVLGVLHSRAEPWRSAELIEATGLSAPDVSKALAALVGAGKAHRPTGVQGVYAAGPARTA